MAGRKKRGAGNKVDVHGRSGNYYEVLQAGKEAVAATTSAKERQVGGDHYIGMAIQPAEYAYRNNLGFLEGTAIGYISRHKSKGGREDLKKAIHTLEMLIELEYDEP